MSSQVEASTSSAGAFFSENRLLVPDFQRRYKWEIDAEVEDFWRDLSGAVDVGDYFLGLVILSELNDRKEVVDGQQRLLTTTILANVLRLELLKMDRRLVAERIRTDFLYSVNYREDTEEPRMVLTDEDDQRDLQALLTADAKNPPVLRDNSAIHRAHSYLEAKVKDDLEADENPALRAGHWSDFLSTKVTFAFFVHPNRGAAFRVYEVVNRRGRDLTPSELVKSHLVGVSGDDSRESTRSRWKSIEEQLEAAGGLGQFTTFVRHVVTLDRGYVIPSDLYQVVAKNYDGAEGVQELLRKLEHYLPLYTQMIDPASDVESSETRTRAYILLEALSMARLRPIFLAASSADNEDELLGMLIRIIAPGAISGRFGTGSIEAQFARAARAVADGATNETWDAQIARLSALRPDRDEFRLRFQRGFNKHQVLVARSAVAQRNALPELEGYPHQIRPRGTDDWPNFDADEYRVQGGLVSNWILTTTERRPLQAKTPLDVKERLLSTAIREENPPEIVDTPWTATRVKAESLELANKLIGLWYGAE